LVLLLGAQGLTLQGLTLQGLIASVVMCKPDIAASRMYLATLLGMFSCKLKMHHPQWQNMLVIAGMT